MDEKFVLVATSSDAALREAAVLCKNHGKHAAAAYVAASMLAQENGRTALSEGVRLYREVAEKHRKSHPELFFRVHQMAGWTAWAGIPHTGGRLKVKWPIQVPRENMLRHGGYLNFLLFEGLKNLGDDQTNTMMLAKMGVRNFLDWMIGLKGGLRSLRRKAA